MEEALQIRKGIVIPGWELWFTSSKSTGSGGQHVNTTNSRVTLHWSFYNSSVLTSDQKERIKKCLSGRINREGVLQIHVDSFRSQYRNRVKARERLATLVKSVLLVSIRRIPTKPSAGSRLRRLRHKKHRANIKILRRSPVQNEDWILIHIRVSYTYGSVGDCDISVGKLA